MPKMAIPDVEILAVHLSTV